MSGHTTSLTKQKGLLSAAVIVAALGYFVDIYDLVLFSIVRTDSLTSLGYSAAKVFEYGVLLLNVQMTGMLVGGIMWGILGDKKGRVSVLFGSIILYSIANIANGFVDSVESYAILRFLAGIGLAGELGAGITLVSEVLPKEKRGYGTMIVAAVGISGALLAGLVSEMKGVFGNPDNWWRISYFIGGGLGLILLVLRVSVFESGMFSEMKQKGVRRGHFLSLFTNRARFMKYLRCILIGLPTWYIVGILVTFSPELSKDLGIVGDVTGGRAIMFCYLGLVIGDIISGFFSQYFHSRKKVVFVFLLLAALFTSSYFLIDGASSSIFYAVCILLGIGVGYWAVFITIAAEQFGTNMRATVATTVPNFVRGAVVPLTFLFHLFNGYFSRLNSAAVIGGICIFISLLALWGLKETHGTDLDFLEE